MLSLLIAVQILVNVNFVKPEKKDLTTRPFNGIMNTSKARETKAMMNFEVSMYINGNWETVDYGNNFEDCISYANSIDGIAVVCDCTTGEILYEN